MTASTFTGIAGPQESRELVCLPEAAAWYLHETDDRLPGETVAATIPLGGRVSAITVSPDGERTYVGQPDSVAVIDGSHHLMARIPVKGDPRDLAITADGTQLLVIHHGGSVSVVDLASYAVKTIAEGWNSDVVVGSGGRLVYAAHNGTEYGGRYSMISVIDADGALVATIPLVNEVTGLSVSPDGTRLYAVSTEQTSYNQYPASWLTIIDTTDYAPVDTLEIDTNPQTITVSPDGLRLYITHDGEACVSAVDLTTHAVTAIALDDNARTVTFSPDGTHAYLTHLGSLTAVDTVTHETQEIVAGDLPRGVQITPDGKRAYVTNFGDHSVSVIDTITNTVTNTLAVGGHPEVTAVSPDGQRVYVGDYWAGTVTVIAAASVE